MTLKLFKPKKPLVGYGKPPDHTKFKPGVSGNPNGRPKKVTSFGELLQREAQRLIQVKVGSKTVKMTQLTVLVRQLMKLALTGDLQAAKLVLNVLSLEAANSGEQNFEAAQFELPSDDNLRVILKELAQTLGEK